jgi:hypothetical protein
MAIFWSILVLSSWVAVYTTIAMKLQVNEKLPSNESISWWRGYRWKVSRKYKELYPDSWLPLIDKSNFWLCLGLAALVLLSPLWKSN